MANRFERFHIIICQATKAPDPVILVSNQLLQLLLHSACRCQTVRSIGQQVIRLVAAQGNAPRTTQRQHSTGFCTKVDRLPTYKVRRTINVIALETSVSSPRSSDLSNSATPAAVLKKVQPVAAAALAHASAFAKEAPSTPNAGASSSAPSPAASRARLVPTKARFSTSLLPLPVHQAKVCLNIIQAATARSAVATNKALPSSSSPHAGCKSVALSSCVGPYTSFGRKAWKTVQQKSKSPALPSIPVSCQLS